MQLTRVMSAWRGSYLRYGETWARELVLTVARHPLDVLSPVYDEANASSELIPVKPDGVIYRCRVMGFGRCL